MIDPTLTLKGSLVRLEPLSVDHVPGLAKVGLDPQIWEFMLRGNIQNEQDIRLWVEDMLLRKQRAGDVPFAVIYLPSEMPCGATRFSEIHPEHRSLEIGGTWYGTQFQRTGVNTEVKYLMLRYAFEVFNCIRVQLKTDVANERSQKAIERLGAVREGVLRSHMILWNGRRRDTIIYSILDSEWPGVKLHLEKWLANHGIQVNQ